MTQSCAETLEEFGVLRHQCVCVCVRACVAVLVVCELDGLR